MNKPEGAAPGPALSDATVPPPDAPEPGPSELSLGRRFFNVQTLASFAIAFAILFFFATRVNIDLGATLRAIRGANPLYYLLGFAAYYLVFPIRAVRWRQMLLNSGVSRDELPSLITLLRIIFLSWFANCLVPAKLGDVYRAYLLKVWGHISGSKAGGTIVAERLLDLTTLLFLAGSTAFFSLRRQPPEKLAAVTGPLELMAALVIAAGLGLAAMRYWSRYLRRLVPSRFQSIYVRFEEGAVGSFGRLELLLPLSLASWFCEGLRLFFVAHALGLTLSNSLPLEFAMITTVALVASLLTALPLTPAGLGFVESGLVAALLLMGVKDESLAFSVAFLDRTISYASILVLGLVAYLLSMRPLRATKVSTNGSQP